MKVEPISNGNLRIWLSEEEWQKRNAADGWPLLRRLLQSAQKSLKRMGKQIVAELIPVAGGWLLLLSARREVLGGELIYHIDALDTLYCLAEEWVRLEHTQPTQTALYEAQTGYDLIVYPAPHLSREQARLLRTYGLLLGQGMLIAAQVAEHSRLLAAGDALERLLITAHEPTLPKPADEEN